MKYGFAGVSVTASSFERWVAGSADSNVMLACGSVFMLTASSVTLAGGSALMVVLLHFFFGVPGFQGRGKRNGGKIYGKMMLGILMRT